MSKGKCFYCGGEAENTPIHSPSPERISVDCAACGHYAYTASAHTGDSPFIPKDKNKLISYLYYNGKIAHSIVKKDEFCNFLGTDKEFMLRHDNDNRCVHVTDELVNNWYPQSFNEKINLILVGIAHRSSSFGEKIKMSLEEAVSCLFLKRYNDKGVILCEEEIINQIKYLAEYLEENLLVEVMLNNTGSLIYLNLTLLPQGWQRVDEIQKNEAKESKYVFVAMSFNPEMNPVRDAIKTAITECHLLPRIMDEIEHNHQIVPEMLSEIRKSRFVIAELTGHNNGAYFEAGYALGFGKDVIHVCKKEQFDTDGHFDVKQVNTILWQTENDLKEKLIKRINATIT